MDVERITIPLHSGPSRSLWDVGGHVYELTVWTPEEWDRVPTCDRPATAQRHLGVGWANLAPARGR